MIIVYGGSFNPPTLAHQKIAEHVLREIPHSTLIFTPVGNQYNKPELIDSRYRLDMLNILIKTIPNCEVSDFETRQNSFKGTFHTLNHLKELHAKDEIGFLIGADNLKGLSNWLNIEHLLMSFKIIVLGRDGIDCSQVIEKDYLLRKYHDSFIILTNFRTLEISSYEFRNEGQDQFVRNDILDYIKEHNLYNR